MALKAGSGIQIRGATELNKALNDLEPKIVRKRLMTGLRAGAKVVLAQAQVNMPVQSGMARGSLKVRAAKAPRGGGKGMSVTTSEGLFKGDSFYVAFIEFGTSRMPAQAPIRRAYESTKEQAKGVAEQMIRDGIEAEVRQMKVA